MVLVSWSFWEELEICLSVLEFTKHLWGIKKYRYSTEVFIKHLLTVSPSRAFHNDLIGEFLDTLVLTVYMYLQ